MRKALVGIVLLAVSVLFVHFAPPGTAVPKAFVFGGETVSSENFEAQFVVAVRFVDVNGDPGICTGSLISREIVLTAGHCVKDVADSIEVVLSTDYNSYSADDAYHVVRYTHPPRYERDDPGFPLGNPYDIALLRLDRPTPSWTRPALIPQSGDYVGQIPDVRVAGFGATSFIKSSRESVGVDRMLRRARVDISTAGPQFFELDQTNGMGVCVGDSGGPIYLRRGGDYAVIVMGILAFVYSKRSEDDYCRGSSRIINIGAWHEWITANAAALMQPA